MVVFKLNNWQINIKLNCEKGFMFDNYLSMNFFKKLLKDKTELNTLILIPIYIALVISIWFNPQTFTNSFTVILVLSVFLVLYPNALLNKYFAINITFLWIAAFLLHMASVKTGRIFGDITYNQALGFKWLNTPVFIGLFWLLICYCSIQMAHYVLKFNPLQNVQAAQLVLALLAGVFMVVLDIFIEPAAAKLGLWSWDKNLIPLQNFTAWFCFGSTFCFWMIKSGIMQINKMGLRFYLILLLFFALINMAQLV